MTEEKGPRCSLAQTMLEKYLPDAVSAHKEQDELAFARGVKMPWRTPDQYKKTILHDESEDE